MKKISLGLVVAGLLVSAGCALPAWLGMSQPATLSSLTTTSPTSTTTNASTPLLVSWQTPIEIPSEHWFVKATSTDQLYSMGYLYGELPTNDDIEIHYYQVGTLVYQNVPSQVIVVTAYTREPGAVEDYYFFVQNDKSLTYVSSESSHDEGTQNLKPGFQSGIFADNPSIVFPDLHYPATLHGQNAGQIVDFKREFFADSSNSDFLNLFPSFVDPANGQVFTSTSTNGFYLKRGPLLGEYALTPAIYEPDKDKNWLSDPLPVIWSDGTKNDQIYSYQTAGGCGASDYANVVGPDQITTSTDLVIAGHGDNGDTVYALKDTNSSLLKDTYNYTFVPGVAKPTYAAFLKDHPLIFWIDPFGRTIELKNSKYLPQAECGKPVIYLYPTKTTTTTVLLQPQGGFTYSEPTYVVNWYVLAQPNGHLTDIRTNKEYHYLFWEGRGEYYEQPKLGWVVKQADLKTFIPQKLKLYGLKDSEISDFLEFWLPRMQDKPYYFVTFMDNKTMDTLAPMTVTPKPDTVIRVLMDFTGLDKPKTVQGYTIHTPKRTGFTVVEWGGVIR